MTKYADTIRGISKTVQYTVPVTHKAIARRFLTYRTGPCWKKRKLILKADFSIVNSWIKGIKLYYLYILTLLCSQGDDKNNNHSIKFWGFAPYIHHSSMRIGQLNYECYIPGTSLWIYCVESDVIKWRYRGFSC